MAIQVATGKINAMTGSPLTPRLHRVPQNYLVTPTQPWLDGFCVEKGVIRQFVAMPLGEGYSVEEQIARTAEHGGLQLIVYPLKVAAYQRLQRAGERIRRPSLDGAPLTCRQSDMGLAPGGQMRQEVFEDSFDPADWSQKQVSRCFITIVNAALWPSLTRAAPPSVPPTASDYTKAGLPWLEYYDPGSVAVPGSDTLAKTKSVKAMRQDCGVYEKASDERGGYGLRPAGQLRTALDRCLSATGPMIRNQCSSADTGRPHRAETARLPTARVPSV